MYYAIMQLCYYATCYTAESLCDWLAFPSLKARLEKN